MLRGFDADGQSAESSGPSGAEVVREEEEMHSLEDGRKKDCWYWGLSKAEECRSGRVNENNEQKRSGHGEK